MLDRDVLDVCRLQHRCPPVLTKHSQYGPHPLASNQNTETLQQEIFPLTVCPHMNISVNHPLNVCNIQDIFH